MMPKMPVMPGYPLHAECQARTPLSFIEDGREARCVSSMFRLKLHSRLMALMTYGYDGLVAFKERRGNDNEYW